MTREEALEILDRLPTIGEQVDALEMAIEALQAKTDGDTISRQGAIDYIKTQRGRPFIGITLEEAIIMMIEEVPSAQPGCEDAVSRADVDILIEEAETAWLKGDILLMYPALKKGLQKVPSVMPKQPGWIPVTERLPDRFGDVLCTFIPSGGSLWTTVIIAHYSDLMGIAKPCFWIGEVGKNNFRDITEQVTAWMPLPEPYREDGEA